MSTHPDLPDTLVHFTGRPRRQSDLPPDFAHGGAEDRLVSILHSGTLRGAPDYWSDAPVISFSEVTEDARRAMLRDGAGRRGPYAPWGLVLDRQQLIGAGARPALYVSREERDRMRAELPPRTYNRCVVYEPHPGRRRSDWLHEREWRLCFEAEAEPVLSIWPEVGVEAGAVSFTHHLVAGVIVGTQGWTPPPRDRSPEEAVSGFATAVQAVQRLMRERPDVPWPGIPVGSYSIGFARSANGMARWYWNGEALVPDGVIDIQAQERETTMRWGGTLPGFSVTVGPEGVRTGAAR
ncbi:hypothetical protein OG625_00250 [Streptomyces sp. NBC_01351]|uniref:hypothetical protein n=1 Tax=Streptomyces sp. NBC_01351 TaxID=2903833 RepID=UPI002E32ADC9|nr:hypothetical protein [Streptomyces sp. NBC_01351]